MNDGSVTGINVGAGDGGTIEQAAVPEVTPVRPRGHGFGLSLKLICLTVVFVMISEVAAFVPAISGYRVSFLEERLATAEAASVLLGSSAWSDVPRAVQDELLASVGATAIVLRTGDVTRLLATNEMPPSVDEIADLRHTDLIGSAAAAIATLLAWQPRTLRVIGPEVGGQSLELVISDRPLRAAMLNFAWAMLVISAVISILTAVFIYVSLQRMLIRPMRRLAQAMVLYSEDPEDRARIIEPSGRSDEIGIAEVKLAAMQGHLTETLAQKRHLADLGLAVSKVNHDLRNLLASAQLFSDRIAALPDPAVQRFAPKLIAALGRAIEYCQSTLTYGRAREREPQRRLVALARVVHDAAEVLGLDNHPDIRFESRVASGFEVDADPEQLFRVVLNLCRNAVQAMEGEADPAVVRRLWIEARREGSVVSIRVGDTGPGVSVKAREHLFQAFQGGVRPGGTGLGLAIAAEIVRAHGGTIGLVDQRAPGAVFEITIPDRPIALDLAARARVG
ncbi:sensor histidine kinase [Kaistia adipata]|uniref:sensor histidine kinase n=1 Tax=Kaistia adipata TaxID=166954 RepID=UPI000410F919|nr:HAMP domain-containing sensor histidine kinase [Kaistia adipata]